MLIRATWILFSSHLRQTVFSRRALICTGLVLMPVLASTMIALLGEGRHGGAAFGLAIGWLMQVQSVVPLIALIIGSGVVSEEVENRTISYLFTRPIPRAAVLLGRWLAGLLLISVLLAASNLAVSEILEYAAHGDEQRLVPPDVRMRLLWVTLIAGAVYSAVFAAAGALLKHAIIVGLAYTFAVEGFMANLPGGNQSITIQYYLKSYLVADDPEVLSRWPDGLLTTELVPQGDALQMLAWILVVSLILGSWAISRKQYVLPS
jgi:hypothetical protein